MTSSSASSAPSALKLQHAVTASLEATAWMRLFNGSGRYQQTILTSLTLNHSTSAWLTLSPLCDVPAYCMRDADYRLAARHRLGMLPYSQLRDEWCSGCATRDCEATALLNDPDHAHSCIAQRGGSRQHRHDAVKNALAGLARSCGFHVEVEPQFPLVPRVSTAAAAAAANKRQQSDEPDKRRGDLLLLRDNVRLLIDVTVVRPTAPTQLRAASATGPHLQPLAAAAAAELQKHRKYDSQCAAHGWTLVPFVLETYGAHGTQARQLLQRMAPHAVDHSPEAFLAHATAVLSVALQAGNAHVAAQATAQLYLQQHRRGVAGLTSGVGSGPSAMQRKRANAALKESHSSSPLSFGDIAHAGLHSSRVVSAARRQLTMAAPAAA